MQPSGLIYIMIYNMTTISVILVTGGSHGVGLASVELLHTNGSHLCSLPDLPSIPVQIFCNH